MNEAEVMEACGEGGIQRMVAAIYRQVWTEELSGLSEMAAALT